MLAFFFVSQQDVDIRPTSDKSDATKASIVMCLAAVIVYNVQLEFVKCKL